LIKPGPNKLKVNISLEGSRKGRRYVSVSLVQGFKGVDGSHLVGLGPVWFCMYTYGSPESKGGRRHYVL